MADSIEYRLSVGDEQVFELLYRKYFVRLCAFANKFLFDPQLSEEVVQDVFFNLWKNRKNIKDDGTIKSYLFQSIHNKSINQLERQKVINKNSELIRFVYANSSEFDVHESLLAKELQKRSSEIIENLAPQCRKIFMMSRTLGKTHHEIADELQISIKTVETQISRALKKLRSELSEYMAIILIILFRGI